MTDNNQIVLFPYPICGKRTGVLVGIDPDGHHICLVGTWKFVYIGNSRILEEGEELPPAPPPIDPGQFESRVLVPKQDAWGDDYLIAKNLDKELGIRDKPKTNCKCGCGGQTNSLFVPGHDMRVKGMIAKMKKGELQFENLPEITRNLLTTDSKWIGRMKDAGLL